MMGVPAAAGISILAMSPASLSSPTAPIGSPSISFLTLSAMSEAVSRTSLALSRMSLIFSPRLGLSPPSWSRRCELPS
ncbi:Uncharacterised protein [Mycobacteroides abscessus subsp. abscessus]|nr:Uncharacterised protein [Mycobacteroides abscessus subsp. abscessus]